MAITPQSFTRNPLLLFLLCALALPAAIAAMTLCDSECQRQQESDAIAQVQIAAKAQAHASAEHASKAATEAPSKGWLGIRIQTLNPVRAERIGAQPNLRGVLIVGLQNNMPAQRAGLLPNDVITHFAGKRVSTNCQLSKTVAATAPGTSVAVRVIRNGVPLVLMPTLTEAPDGCGR